MTAGDAAPAPRERVALHGVAETLLITVYLRACDARAPRPILGDPWAPDLVARADHDFSAFRRGRANAPVIAERAAVLDRWTAAFLRAHPEGQVLHLGCGLDSRPLRVDRPATSRWIDVDQPEVVALRRRLYDLPDDLETVAASVTDEDWWDRVDTGRPTAIVAEGLLMYLDPADVHALAAGAVARLGTVELLFDTVAPWLVALSRRSRTLRRSGVRFASAREDLTGVHGGRMLDSVSLVGALGREAALATTLRRLYAGLGRVPAMRDALRLERLALGASR